MGYITRAEVENFTGFGYRDFKCDGRAMTSSEFEDLIRDSDLYVTQMIHRYCNVTSFELHDVAEYHDGRGGSNDERAHYQHIEADRRFYLRDNPVQSLTKVEVDLNPPYSVPNWVGVRERSDESAGDFIFVNEHEHAYIRFHNRVPWKGYRNVRISYVAGYAPESEKYQGIKMIALRMVTNLLLLKKKYQEATTIRAANVKDFAQMFDTFQESDILTIPVAAQLELYRRITVPTSAGYL